MGYERPPDSTSDSSSLTVLERGVVTLVVAAIDGDAQRVGDAHALLRACGIAPATIAAIEQAPGWPVTDDDRLDVILSVAARWTHRRRSMSERDIERLRAVGLTDAHILDLAHEVAGLETVTP